MRCRPLRRPPPGPRVLPVVRPSPDLKGVEGIGPKIEELLQAGGVGTWAGLATTAVERLQEILDGGGPRYQVHDPGTWPRQADLLASARWDEFTTLTDELDGGRE